MFLSQADLAALGQVLSLLADDVPAQELRLELGTHLLPLLRADYFASYVWDPQVGRFIHGVSLNMDQGNIARYESTYQFISPITTLLQARRGATIVSEVYPHQQLLRTEYFNEFLTRDGLHWGMTLHVYDGPSALGDFRIWRATARGEYSLREKQLLNLVDAALLRALRRRAAQSEARVHAEIEIGDQLSDRERAVAYLVSCGMTDKEIARKLQISPTTVRTYVQRLFRKLGISRRSAVARLSGTAW
jgi:DNA-binding CsgD family transcriptional regulator